MEWSPIAVRHDRYAGASRRLLREEERVIAERARRNDRDAIERLVSPHLPLVAYIARGYRNRGVPFEDLVGEGCVGLLKAVRRFEPSTGTRFTTYASFWIRKQMLQALGDQTRVIHVPRYARQNGERAPREVRIDAEPAGTGGARLADRLADHALVSATDRLIGDQTLIKLRRQVRALPARERMVVARRFGLDGEAPVTLGDVGRHLGISRERVRQIERAALARLLKGIRRSSL